MKTTDNEKKSYFEKKSKEELIEICLSDSDECPYAAYLVLETLDQRDRIQQLEATIEAEELLIKKEVSLWRLTWEIIEDMQDGDMKNEKIETFLQEIKNTRKTLNSFIKEIRAKTIIERPEDAIVEVLNADLRYSRIKRN